MDHGTPESHRHSPVEIVEGVARRRTPSVLDHYRTRGLLHQADPRMNRLLYEAGLRLASDHARSGWLPRTTPRYAEPVGGSSGGAPSDWTDRIRIDAYASLRAAERVLHPVELEVVWRVCVRDQPAGRDMDDLRRGLAALARHYGLMTKGRGAAA